MNDAAVLTAARGFIYLGDPGAKSPTPEEVKAFVPRVDGFKDFGVFKNIGHTDRDDLPEFQVEGGSKETRGTWQNEALKVVVTEAAVDSLVITLNQFDEFALMLYYGSRNASTVPGEFAVADNLSAGLDFSLLLIIVDGGINIGFFAAKATISRDDSMEFAVDGFNKLPIKATFVKNGTDPLFKWLIAAIPAVTPPAPAVAGERIENQPGNRAA